MWDDDEGDASSIEQDCGCIKAFNLSWAYSEYPSKGDIPSLKLCSRVAVCGHMCSHKATRTEKIIFET